jgi:hypothetical protein
MTTDHIVSCDGCGEQLFPDMHVTRIGVMRQVNHGREESKNLWLWERPMLKPDDPPRAGDAWSFTNHYCSDCMAAMLCDIPLPVGFEEECP